MRIENLFIGFHVDNLEVLHVIHWNPRLERGAQDEAAQQTRDASLRGAQRRGDLRQQQHP
jgi:hypothetical protein